MHTHISLYLHLYVYTMVLLKIFFSFFIFFLLSLSSLSFILDSTGPNYRGYIILYTLIHSFIHFFLRPRSRLLPFFFIFSNDRSSFCIYFELRNQLLTFNESLNSSSSSISDLNLSNHFFAFNSLLSLLFDTNTMHCLEAKQFKHQFYSLDRTRVRSSF